MNLRDDEALIVEATVPKQCVYRSMILTNELYETTDWYNNHSSLNDAQAAPDARWRTAIVVSAKDPGVPNWLDTAGYPTGVIQGRWFQCDTQPVPSIRKVALDRRAQIVADGHEDDHARGTRTHRSRAPRRLSGAAVVVKLEAPSGVDIDRPSLDDPRRRRRALGRVEQTLD